MIRQQHRRFLSVESNNGHKWQLETRRRGGWVVDGGGCEVNCSPPKVFAERVNPRSSHPARLSSAPQIN